MGPRGEGTNKVRDEKQPQRAGQEPCGRLVARCQPHLDREVDLAAILGLGAASGRAPHRPLQDQPVAGESLQGV